VGWTGLLADSEGAVGAPARS